MPAIPAAWEAEISRIMIQDQPEQKISETPSQQTSWAWCWYMPVIAAMEEAWVVGSRSQDGLGKK
jgi:hypothetical protein